ncbi:MAG: NUDIX hydrolase [Desulfurococcaceae archaeon]
MAEGAPEVGVGAVVLDGDEVLLVRRARPPCRGCWSIPGGRLRYGEGIFEGAAREVLEETGIAIEPLGVIFVGELLEEGYHYVIIDVLARPLNRDVRAGSDAMEAGFFSIASPPSPLGGLTAKLLSWLRSLVKGGDLEVCLKCLNPA